MRRHSIWRHFRWHWTSERCCRREKFGVVKNLSFGSSGRIRNYRTVSENQVLALPDTQIDAQKLRDSSELIEIIRSWGALPEALKAGVLAIVRSGEGERK
jgi:hypothetical protein